MTGLPRYPEKGEVVLGTDDAGDGVQLKLIGPVSTSIIGVYPPKQVIGDFTRDSHEMLSAFIQADWSGGGQINDIQESTDVDRYFFATLEARYPKMLALLPLATKVTGPNTTGARPLADRSSLTYASFGTTLISYNAAVVATTIGTLAGTPVNRGVVFRGTGAATKLFLPYGSTGYETYDGSALSGLLTTTTPVALAKWDDKLYSLEHDGDLRVSIDGTTWTDVTSIDESYTPRHLVPFYDRSESPSLHAITDTAVFELDLGIPSAKQTEVTYPPHPDNGLGAAKWNTDLFTSVGIGITRYTGGIVQPGAGPDRGDSLPAGLAGKIVDLVPSYNALYALLEGVNVGEFTEDFLEGGGMGDPFFISGTTSVASILLFDGRGWHAAWVAPQAGGSPTLLHVAAFSDGTHRLWWGWDGDLYYQDLPRTFQNPKINETANYAPSGYLEIGAFDGAMTGVRKIWLSIEIDTLGCSATETVTISYRKDDDPGWTQLGSAITTNGHHVFRIGEQGTLPDGAVRHNGIGFEKLAYRLDLIRGTDTKKTPIVESVVISYLKRMGKLKAFQFTVDCTLADAVYKGKANKTVMEYLESLIDEEVLIPFGHQDDWLMVKVTGVSGADETGTDLRGSRRVSVAEVFEVGV